MVILTLEGYNKNIEKINSEKSKLAQLAAKKNDAYSNAGDGTHDNPLYHMITAEYDEISNMIRKLERILQDAKIIDTEMLDCSEVNIGTVVELEVISTNKTTKNMEMQIVDPLESSLEDKKISYRSPVGNMLMGLKVNESNSIIVKGEELIYKVKQIGTKFRE